MLKKITFIIFLSCFFTISFTQNLCGLKNEKTEKDSLKCLEQLSLFKSYYAKKYYLEAYPYWKKIVETCPCASIAVFDSQYLQDMFDALISSTKDIVLKIQYIEDVLFSVGERDKYFPKNYTKGDGLGYKAHFLLRYKENTLENRKLALNLFVESIEMEKENTQPLIWDSYFRVTEQMVRTNKDTVLMIEAYERAVNYIEMAIVKHYLSQDTMRINHYRKTLKNIETTFAPFAPCSVLERVYRNKWEQYKNDLPVLKKMLIAMKSRGCNASPLFDELLNIVHRAEPDAQTNHLMGYYSLKQDNYEAALEFFKEAVRLFETDEQKVEPWYMIGFVYQINGKYADARDAALQAIKLNPNCGKAYILIGDMYATSVHRCRGEDSMPLDYNWAAADKYARAAEVDPSVAEQANAKRAKLRFPTEQDKLQRGWTTSGAEYKVKCWIQETTTVR